jgi:hypothetical protein
MVLDITPLPGIEIVNEIKFVGLILCVKLNFDSHSNLFCLVTILSAIVSHQEAQRLRS